MQHAFAVPNYKQEIIWLYEIFYSTCYLWNILVPFPQFTGKGDTISIYNKWEWLTVSEEYYICSAVIKVLIEGNTDYSMRHEFWSVTTGGEDSNAESQDRAVLGETEELFFPAPKIPQDKSIMWKTGDILGFFKVKGLPFSGVQNM